MMINKLGFSVIVLLLLLGVSSLFAQQNDHFSGFYKSDLALNPALTGSSIGKYRITTQMRVQDYSGQGSELSNTFSVDTKRTFQSVEDFYGMRTVKDREFSWGFGYFGQMRNQAVANYNYQSHYISVAYHRILKNIFSFSIGTQLGAYYHPTIAPASLYGFDFKTESSDSISSSWSPDVNAGIVLGWGKTTCWKEDQLYKLTFGVSGYHLLSAFAKSDSLILPAREIKAHIGYLLAINRSIGLVPRIYANYDGDLYYMAGSQLLWRAHFSFIDRLRIGGFYRSDDVLSLSFGMRLFWHGYDSMNGFDLEFSYDLPLGDKRVIGMFDSAFEFSITFQPFKKCWETSSCSGAYRYESF